MWNRRKEEEYSPRPTATPAASVPEYNPPASTPVPAAPLPSRISEPESPRGNAAIGKNVVVKGQIFSREDIYIDGEIDGNVEAQENRVTIGPNGKLMAGVKAREVVVLGSVSGNVEATDKIDIRKDAKLIGDIKTARIVIEDGAYFKGSIDITRTEKPKPPVEKPAPAPVKDTIPVAEPRQSAPLAATATDLTKK